MKKNSSLVLSTLFILSTAIASAADTGGGSTAAGGNASSPGGGASSAPEGGGDRGEAMVPPQPAQPDTVKTYPPTVTQQGQEATTTKPNSKMVRRYRHKPTSVAP